MFERRTIKAVASCVVAAYLSILGAEGVLASDMHLASTPMLLAQAGIANADPDEAKALQQIYNEKIKRIEAEINNAKGTRRMMMTTAVSAFFIGAGVMVGATNIRSAAEDIPVDAGSAEEDNKDQALTALDAVKGVGGGIIGLGGASVLGYLVYTAIISSKQHKIDTLRS